MKKIAISFCVVLYAIVVPFLEINATHVFNPDWTPHVRIHEVWQLITNSSIGILCLYWSWVKKETLKAAILSLIITGGFLVAFLMRSSYGGSMKYLDGSEKTILGVNIGLLGFGVAFLFIVLALIFDRE